jgi:hypothetical protein
MSRRGDTYATLTSAAPNAYTANTTVIVSDENRSRCAWSDDSGVA